MSRTTLRVLLGVAAATFSVVALFQERLEPAAADRVGDSSGAEAPAALAPDAGTALAPTPRAAPSRSPPSLEGDGGGAGRASMPSAGPAAPLPGGQRIHGRLEMGRALPPGLVVRAIPVEVGAAPGAAPGVLVDVPVAPDGTFSATVPKTRVARVYVSWDDGSVEIRHDLCEGESSELVLRIGTARLEGRILDAAGRPVPGVYLRDDFRGGRFEEDTGLREAVTDAGGTWRIDHLPAGEHAIQASWPAGADCDGDVRWESVDLAHGERRVLELGIAATDAIWTGRIRRGGGPLPGPGHLFLTVGNTHLRTPYDGQGRFRIAAPPGPYRVVIEPRGPRRGFVLDLPPELRAWGASPAPADSIVLRRHVNADVILVGGAVSGRLLAGARPEDGMGAIAFRRTISASSSPVPDADPVLESLSEDLRFQAVALPPGRYLLAGFRLGGTVDLHGPDGRPILVDVVDGGEVTGLELSVVGP